MRVFVRRMARLVALGLCICCLAACHIEGAKRRDVRHKLVAVGTKTGLEASLSGGCFLLVGSITGEAKEVAYGMFYWQDRRGGIHYEQHQMHMITIFEDAPPDKPYVLFAEHSISGRTIIEHYKLHVPPGSIARTVNIGLP